MIDPRAAQPPRYVIQSLSTKSDWVNVDTADNQHRAERALLELKKANPDRSYRIKFTSSSR